MHLEPLEQRQMWAAAAAAGIDRTFGGTTGVHLPSGNRQFGDVALPVSDGIFVELAVGNKTYVVKYTDGGVIDRTWADRGQLLVKGDVTRLACDPFTRYLYVGSTADRALTIERITPIGTPDTTFGVGGTFRYDPAGASDGRSKIVLQGLVPIRGGRLLVAMRRDSLSNETYVDGATYQDQAEDVAVMQVRNNGTRDPAFGQYGVVSLLGGGSRAVSDDFGSTIDTGTLVDITDFQAEGDDSFDVAIARRVGDRMTYQQSTQYEAILTVKTRVLTGDGTLDDRYAFSWDIVDKAAGVTKLNAPFIRFDADAVSVFDAEIGRKTSRNVRYNLVAGLRPRVDVLSIDSQPNSAVALDADGYYYAAIGNFPRRVVKLRSRLTYDRTFADRGLATASAVSTFIPDDDGGVYAISAFTLQRLA